MQHLSQVHNRVTINITVIIKKKSLYELIPFSILSLYEKLCKIAVKSSNTIIPKVSKLKSKILKPFEKPF